MDDYREEELELTSAQAVEDHFDRRIGDVGFVEDVWDRASINHDFVRGYDDSQWEGNSARDRRALGKATLTINDTSRIINHIAGREVTGRVRPDFKGRDFRDEWWVEICKRVMQAMRDRADHEQSESETFRNLLIENVSWLRWRQDFMRGPVGVGMTVVEPVHHWEMVWDRAARAKNLLDRMWDCQGYWVSFEEFSALWPDAAKDKSLMAGSKSYVEDDVRARGEWPFRYAVGRGARYYDRQKREVFVTHYCWREMTEQFLIEPEPGKKMVLETRELLEQAVENYRMMSAALPPEHPAHMSDLPYKPVPRWKHREAYFVGGEVIQEIDPLVNEFPRQAMTGIPYRSPEEVSYYGVVDQVRDAAALKNAFLSMMITAFQTSAKGGLAVVDGTLENESEAKRNVAQSGGIVKFRNGTDIDKAMKELKSGQLPQQMVQLYEYANNAVYTSAGINPAAIGDIQDLRRVSGKVEQSVKESASLAFAAIFDSLRLYRKQAGRLAMMFMRAYYDEEDVKRLVGPDMAEPKMDEMTGEVVSPGVPPKSEWESLSEFDVIVDEAEARPDEAAEAMRQLVQHGGFQYFDQKGLIPPEVIPDLFSAMGIDQSTVTKLRAHMQKLAMQPQLPPQPNPEERVQ